MGSSSKRKRSKKKSSKLPSKARKLKKTKRTKVKKLGCRHDSSTDNSMSSCSISYFSDSYSSNSDDDSISSKSLSSYNDTHRRKDNESRSQSIKKKKKQVQRRSPSREDIQDLSCARKRKRSKKNGDLKSSKNSKRKKPRREVEISSASSDSRSYSTCDDNISASESIEGERVRGRLRKNKNDRRDKRKGKLQSALSPHRSPNPFSYSEDQDENYTIIQSEETYTSGLNSRRLKSVIVFAEKPEPGIRENESEKDMQKEELVYDHDDYPSKSSSGEGSKKVSTPHPPYDFYGAQRVESVAFTRDNEVIEHAHEQDHVRNPSSDEYETNNYETERTNNIPLPDSGYSRNDLEAVLKQKALENFKKFRGALKTHVKPIVYENDHVNGDRNRSSSSQTEIVRSRLPNNGFSDVEKDTSDGGFPRQVLGTIKPSPDDAVNVAHCGNPEEGRTIRHVLGKSPMDNSSFGETSSAVDSTLDPTRSSVVCADKSRMETEKDSRSPEPRKVQPKSPSGSTGQDTASSSALVQSAAAENLSSNNQSGEAKDGSQYQQKTMSVMRNGEMVQVNYKVYIPQRAPGLARRRFKR